MYKIIITKTAEQDILEAAKYISIELKNPIAANSLLDLIDKKVESLTEMPERQNLVADDYLKKLGFRALSVNSYLLFYTVNKSTKTVVVQRFLYGKRNWQNLLGSSFEN